jgi:hypothetical protein
MARIESGPPSAARTFRLCRNGVADRIRTDSAGITTPGAAVTPQPPCTTGATGFEPAPSRLTSERSALLELRPPSCAAGIRTQDLELMRLARTAPPLPR